MICTPLNPSETNCKVFGLFGLFGALTFVFRAPLCQTVNIIKGRGVRGFKKSGQRNKKARGVRGLKNEGLSEDKGRATRRENIRVLGASASSHLDTRTTLPWQSDEQNNGNNGNKKQIQGD